MLARSLPAPAAGPTTPLARSPHARGSVSAAGSDSATASPVLSGAASSSKLRDSGVLGHAARQSLGASSAQGTLRSSTTVLDNSVRSTEPAVSLRELDEALQPRAVPFSASPASQLASLGAARKRPASPVAPTASATLPAPKAHSYTVAEGHAAEAQRVQSELAELLANPLVFTTPTPSKSRNVDLPAINGARQAAAQADEHANTSRASGLVPTSVSSTLRRSGDSAGSPSAAPPRSDASGSASAQRDGLSVTYADKLSLQMPGRVRTRPAGLYNFGNTCYMNSVLQSLLHLPPLAYALLERSTRELIGPFGGPTSGNFDPAQAMCDLAEQVLCGSDVVRPIFQSRLKSFAPTLRKGHQEDAHEFLILLLEAMQQQCFARADSRIDANHALRRSTLVQRVFSGRLRSRVSCPKCRHNSDTFDPCLDLSLDIRHAKSVTEALDLFTKAEELSGSGRDRYRCEGCRQRVTASKRFTIDTPPLVLTVHLKRFTLTGAKLTRAIKYPYTLQLGARHLSEGVSPASYTLHAVIHHQGGGPNSGHYIANVKAPRGQGWYQANDSTVSPAQSGKAFGEDKSCYVLFYVMDAASSSQSGALLPRQLGGHLSPPTHNTPVSKSSSSDRKGLSSQTSSDSPGSSTAPLVRPAQRKRRRLELRDDEEDEGELLPDAQFVSPAAASTAPGALRPPNMSYGSKGKPAAAVHSTVLGSATNRAIAPQQFFGGGGSKKRGAAPADAYRERDADDEPHYESLTGARSLASAGGAHVPKAARHASSNGSLGMQRSVLSGSLASINGPSPQRKKLKEKMKGRGS